MATPYGERPRRWSRRPYPAKRAAERLALALDPATRMTLLEVLSHAAAEITGALDHHAVDVRMSGREPEFVVAEIGPVTAPTSPPPEPPAAAEPEDAQLSRITLRLPESVKTRAVEAATQGGQSLNAWLVDAVRDALDDRGRIDLEPGGSRITVSGGEGNRRRQVRGWVS